MSDYRDEPSSPSPFDQPHEASDPVSSQSGLRSEMRILVVDDFATMRRIIRNLLGSLGYHSISEAENGLAALPMLHNRQFDFVITDVLMPQMSGIELLRAIRTDRKLCHIPVLMITSDAYREKIIEAAEAGVNGYIVKPFTAAMLESKMKRIFARVEE